MEVLWLSIPMVFCSWIIIEALGEVRAAINRYTNMVEKMLEEEGS